LRSARHGSQPRRGRPPDDSIMAEQDKQSSGADKLSRIYRAVHPKTGKPMPVTRGRKKGSKNKATPLREQASLKALGAATSAGVSPPEVMLRLMRRGWADMEPSMFQSTTIQ